MSAVPLTNENAATASGLTAGSLLRQARESAGLHIGALSVALKVPVRKIEALESDRLDLLPDAVFARALASSICRTLKVDAAAVLAGLPQGALPHLKTTDVSRLNASYESTGGSASGAMRELLAKPYVVIGLVLLAGTLLLFLLPAREATIASDAPQPVVTVAAGSAPSAPVSATAPPVVEGAVGTPTGAQALPPAALAAAPQVVLAAEPKATEKPDVSTGGAETAMPPQDGIVVFSAKGTSWVEVTDAGGVVRLRKTLAAGDVAGASGLPPLKVIVGKADLTSVMVRGKAFDLAPLVRDNVARFEVK